MSSNEVLLLKLRANSLSVRFQEHLDTESVRRTSPNQSNRKSHETIQNEENIDEKKLFILENILEKDYMFTVLPRKVRLKYASALRPIRLGPNVTVFKQGDRPDKFYVIETGSLLVTVGKDQSRLVGSGQTFGELAILYQCTRSATVTSKEESFLWYLDRNTFFEAATEIESVRTQRLKSYLLKLNLDHEESIEEEEEENASERFQQLSRRLVFHRFPPKSEILCASQSSTILHVVSGSISHISNKDKKSVVVYGSSSSWFEVCRADEIARDGRRLVSDSSSVTTVLAMNHMDLMSMSQKCKYRRMIESDLEEDSDLPFDSELSSSMRSIKQRMSRNYTSPEYFVQDKINQMSVITTPSIDDDEGDEEKEEEEHNKDVMMVHNSPRLTRRRRQIPLQSSTLHPTDSFRGDEDSCCDDDEEEEDDHEDSRMDDETQTLLVSTLSEHFLFSDLRENELESMVRRMKKRTYKANEWIVRRGEKTSETDCGLFVVGLKSFVLLSENKDDESKRVDAGNTFGASALMFSERHRVSVRTSSEKTELWFLGPRAFHRYRAISASKRRAKIENFVSKSKVLALLPSSCVESLADSFVTHSFLKGTVIIRENDEGDVCYFLEKGRVEISKDGDRMRVLTEGSFFGELALLNKEPRSATVTCLTDVNCLVIARSAFEMLSKNFSNVIRRAMSSPKIVRKSSFFTTDVYMPLSLDEDTSNIMNASSFDVKDCIGEGSYGQVILVKHIETGEPYAVKRVLKRRKKKRGKKKNKENKESEIPREVEILRLMNHRLVSRLVSTFDIGTTMFLVMPFYQGGDMFSMLIRRKKKQLTEKEARFYVAQIHIALMYVMSFVFVLLFVCVCVCVCLSFHLRKLTLIMYDSLS